ncbi:hypothetical protein HX794_03750 [Pseudomonas costantinii]|uniref:hypothetical protein n=1 Tax=Pseudomonas costantinii TaxID=168469 RepID=UPI0015A31D11|nr:hypothetical protein [Pseudomonas costantinii]NVZ18748.1 hypothetical protein [Pseudomonas costantinii]
MSSVIEGFRGRLDITLRRRELIPTSLGGAPFSDDELAVPLQLNFDEKLPIVMSFHEYYRFLERLVTVVLGDASVPLVLARVRMPSTIALPTILLDPRVALFHDLDVESLELQQRGLPHLCIDANFRLYSWSSADNTFSVHWVGADTRQLEPESLKRIEAVIQTLPAEFHQFIDTRPGQ